MFENVGRISKQNTKAFRTFKRYTKADLSTSASIWQTFRAYSKLTKRQVITAFEDKEAKATFRQKRNEQLWFQSPTNVTIDAFLTALSIQYPEAIGGVDTQQGSVKGTVVAFDTIAARDRTCTVGVTLENFTLFGTATLSAESSVYKVSLGKLPILRPSKVSSLLQEIFSQYAKALHVGLYLDPKTKLFFGKGYIMLDVADNNSNVYRSLTHEISLGHHRVILATWRGMEKHCFYCHKPGHTKSGCQRLQRQNIKRCYACKSLEHLVRDCPKIGSPNVGEKRARTESHVSPTTIAQSMLASQPDDSNGSKTEEIDLTTSASKYATIDPVASNAGRSTSTNPPLEQTVDNIMISKLMT
ncbi:hypothetical protein G6F57_004723 [Rhizopus arrhizus]|uniref:CCHC-type domain-containing protein n=1 Tax=Rhizopus oryzae TaxID=64495 RepID=A0A9P6XCX9_RHIOR|nr:hypothetical protein G6F23_001121 [Rhizopus arrhizus]KAG1425783.1 hypothetical protein G6F58_001784 [Rhizopus delemar]KAG0765473.1 hypothetical protein G6F24_004395 [Rhizopus arrhizus]KAG0793160.1 hypothetical protein G6F21_003819 [Rhizopus arrhizus]KAG0814264.1 hypothetical protein G6F20_004910 [Rhizopus arrhizus]